MLRDLAMRLMTAWPTGKKKESGAIEEQSRKRSTLLSTGLGWVSGIGTQQRSVWITLEVVHALPQLDNAEQRKGMSGAQEDEVGGYFHRDGASHILADVIKGLCALLEKGGRYDLRVGAKSLDGGVLVPQATVAASYTLLEKVDVLPEPLVGISQFFILPEESEVVLMKLGIFLLSVVELIFDSVDASLQVLLVGLEVGDVPVAQLYSADEGLILVVGFGLFSSALGLYLLEFCVETLCCLHVEFLEMISLLAAFLEIGLSAC